MSRQVVEESVYNLIPPEIPPPFKQDMYRSRHSGTIPIQKKAGATFGPAPSQTVDPKQFLRKHEKEPVLHDRGQFQYVEEERKPPIPSRKDKPVMGLQSRKNFVSANAIDNILAVPKQPMQREPDYLSKPDYGKVPKYLGQVKAQIKEEYDLLDSMNQQQHELQQDSSIQVLPEEERLAMLAGLKANWERINKEYQTLSFTLDTPAKRKRKEAYEAQLEQIEKDIEKLNRKYIFVSQDY